MPPTGVQSPPGPLQTERLPNGNRKLIRNLIVKLNDETKITVPTDFETNFSSIPWFARSLVDWSKVDIAGVVHDFLYWCPREAHAAGVTTRTHADDIWWELAGTGQHHANRIQRRLGRMALWAFGWRALRKALKTGGRTCSTPSAPQAQPHAKLEPEVVTTDRKDQPT